MNRGDLVRCYVHPDKFIHKSKIKDIVGVLISHKRFKSKITKNWDNEFQVLSQGKIRRVTTELFKIEKIE